MLSKCYVSKRNVTKGWFLKSNKDPAFEITIYHFPNARKLPKDTFATLSYQTSGSKLQGLLFTFYFKLFSVNIVTTTTVFVQIRNPNKSLTILNHYTNHL